MIGPTNANGDVVTLSATQTITGTKTFTKNVTIYNPDKIESADGERVRILMGTSTNLNCPSIISTRMGGVVNRAYFRVTNKTSNKDADFVINATDSGDCYLSAPTRTYSASNTSDVVTIGSLQASTDVVHTTGNETVAGTKTFSTGVVLSSSGLIRSTSYNAGETQSANRYISTIQVQGADNQLFGFIRFFAQKDTEQRILQLEVNKHTAGESTTSESAYLNLYAQNGSTPGYGTVTSRAYALTGNNEILTKSHVADMMAANVGDGQISLTSSRGTAIDNFTVNQSSGKNIVLPASSTQYQDIVFGGSSPTTGTTAFTLQGTPDYADYPYRASYAITGLTADMYANVIYSDAQVASGNYAPFCVTAAGYVYLYANADVNASSTAVTVPTISVGMDDSSAQQSMSNFVTIDGEQTITGVKNLIPNNLRVKDRNAVIYSGTPSSNRQSIMQQMVGSDDVWAYRDEFWKYTTGSARMQHRLRSELGESEIRQDVTSTGVPYASVINQRTYNASNTSDIVTIGSLQASTDVVHTSGNETIAGNKTFNGHTTNTHPTYNVPSTMPRVAGTGWVKMYETTYTNHVYGIFSVLPRRGTSSPGFGIIACGGHGGNGTVICKWMSSNLISSGYINGIMVTIENEKVITIWGKNISATDTLNMRLIADVCNGNVFINENGWTEATDRTIYTLTEDGNGNYTGYIDSNNVTHTFNVYQISS